MLAFEAIASGSGGNLYRVTSEGHAPLLIEAGVPYKRLQRALRFQVTSLAGVLVSHEHGDHARAVPDVLKAGVRVFASPETGDALGVSSHHNFVRIHDGEQFQVRDWVVRPFALVHDVPCLGFLIADKRGEKLLYVSDTAYCPVNAAGVSVFALEANYSRGILDRLVEQGTLDHHHAARVIRNHLSLEHAAQLLAASDLTKCREVHLLHLSGSNASAPDFKAQIERLTGLPTYIAPEGTAHGNSA